MRSRSSTAFAARLPAEEAEQVEEALEQKGWSQSEFVQRALRYYISRNPDDIPALYEEYSVNRLLAEMGGKYD